MKKTIKVEGMMCPHCEAHMKEALEGIEGVVSAVASHTEKNAVIELSKDVSEDVLKAAVEKVGYKFLGVK